MRDRSIDAPGYASNHVLFADASENVNTGELNTPETWPLAAANVNAPAKMWIFTEGTRADPPGAPLRGNRIFSHNSLRGDLPYWPHEGKRKNFLFLDGHIEALDARQVGERNKEKTTAWKEFHGMVRGL